MKAKDMIKEFLGGTRSVASAIAAIAIGIALPAGAASVEVGTYDELVAALAGEAETIAFTNDVTATAALASSRTVALDGQGHVLSVPVTGVDASGALNANASDFILLSNTGCLTVKNLTLRGGSRSCVYNAAAGSLKMVGCTIERTGSDDDDACHGLWNYGGKCYLERCNVARNYGRDAAGFHVENGGYLVLESCSVVENQSLSSEGGGGGGGCYSGSHLIVNNCTFANNASSEIGAGINQYQGNTYVLNSTFVGNVGDSNYGGSSSGGGFGFHGGTFYAANALMVNNYAKIDGGNSSDDEDFRASDVGLYSYETASLHVYGCGYGAARTGDGTAAVVELANSTQVAATGVFAGYRSLGVIDSSGCSGDATFSRPIITRCDNGTYYAPLMQDLKGGTNTYVCVPEDVSTFSTDTIKLGVGTDDAIVALGDFAVAAAADKVTKYQDGSTRTTGVIGAAGRTTFSFVTITVKKAEHGVTTGTTMLYGDTYKCGTLFSVTAVPDEGYDFVGWRVDGESTPSATANPVFGELTADTTLQPVFQGASATIAFDAGGGENPPAAITADYRVGETFIYPAVGNMTRAGYEFRFWVDGNGSCYDPSDESATICGAYVVVTACWQLVVAQQPATNNFYSVGVDTDDEISYQWYAQTATPLSELSSSKWDYYDHFCTYDETENEFRSVGNDRYTFVICFNSTALGDFQFRFKSTCATLSWNNGGFERTDYPDGEGYYTYVVTPGNSNSSWFYFDPHDGDGSNTVLCDPEIVKVEAVPGQTRPYLTDGTVGTQYYCELTYDDGVGEVHVDSDYVTYVGKLGHFHCTCGGEACSGEGHDALALWLPWDGTTTLPDKAGHWVLTNDVVLAATWQPADGTFLCLNGHAVTQNDATMPTVSVAEGVAVTVTDCTGAGAFRGPATAGFASRGNLTLVNVAVSGCEVGVNVTKGKLTVGGTASVTGNTVNVKLASGYKLAISETAPLAAGAQIGVTTTQNLDWGFGVPFTDNGGAEDVAYFIPDDLAARVRTTGDGCLELFIPVTVNPAEVAGATFEVYANEKKVSKDASGYVVPTNTTVTVTYVVTDDAYAFAGGDDSWTTFFNADGVQTSAVPDAPALYWVDEPEFRFDASFTTNEQGTANYVVTHPDQLLPIVYSCGLVGGGCESASLYHWMPGDAMETIVYMSAEAGYTNWTFGVKDFGLHNFELYGPPPAPMSVAPKGTGRTLANVESTELYATILYVTNFCLTVAQSEGGTLAAYTNDVAAGADSWPLALVDEVKLVATPASELWRVESVATNGVLCGDMNVAEPTTNSFTMPLCNVAVTGQFRYVGVELQAEAVEHATMKYFTNDVEVAATGGKAIVVTNVPATVVYEADPGYVFLGGKTVVTNVLDTAKNPATSLGEPPFPVHRDLVVASDFAANPCFSEVVTNDAGAVVGFAFEGKNYLVGTNAFTSFVEAFTNDTIVPFATNLHVFGYQTITAEPPMKGDWTFDFVSYESEPGVTNTPTVSIATKNAGEGFSQTLVNVTNTLDRIVGDGAIVLSVTNGTPGAAGYKADLESIIGDENVVVLYTNFEPERKQETLPEESGAAGKEVTSQTLAVDENSKVEEDGTIVLPGVDTDGKVTVDVTSTTTNDVEVAGKLVSREWDVVIVNETTNTLTVGAVETGMNVLITNVTEVGKIVTLESVIAGKNIAVENNGHLEASVQATDDIEIRNTSLHTLVGTYKAGGTIEITGEYGSLSNVVVDAAGNLTLTGTNVISGPVDFKAGSVIEYDNDTMTAWSVAGDNHTLRIDWEDVADSKAFGVIVDAAQANGDTCGTYVLATNVSVEATNVTFALVCDNAQFGEVAVGADEESAEVRYYGAKAYKLWLDDGTLTFSVAYGRFDIRFVARPSGTTIAVGGAVKNGQAIAGETVRAQAPMATRYRNGAFDYEFVRWEIEGATDVVLNETTNEYVLGVSTTKYTTVSFAMPSAAIEVVAVYRLVNEDAEAGSASETEKIRADKAIADATTTNALTLAEAAAGTSATNFAGRLAAPANFAAFDAWCATNGIADLKSALTTDGVVLKAALGLAADFNAETLASAVSVTNFATVAGTNGTAWRVTVVVDTAKIAGVGAAWNGVIDAGLFAAAFTVEGVEKLGAEEPAEDAVWTALPATVEKVDAAAGTAKPTATYLVRPAAAGSTPSQYFIRACAD